MSTEAARSDEQKESLCPDCQESKDADSEHIDDAIADEIQQRLWLKRLTETYDKIHSAGRYSMPFLGDTDDEEAWKNAGKEDKERFDKAKARLILERDIALTEVCRRITRIARSDLSDGD